MAKIRQSRGRPLRFQVGLKRIHRSTSPAKGSLTRQVRAQMKGIEDNLAKIINAMKKSTPDAIGFALDPILDESQILVPKEFGPLKDSGDIFLTETAGRPHGTVSYGDGNEVPYAIYVHEMITYEHESPTQAKFLQAAVEKHQHQIIPRLHEHLRLQ